MAIYTGQQSRPPGYVWTRRRPGTQLLIERLVDMLVEAHGRYVEALYEQFTDEGRGPWQQRLKPEEQLRRLWEAGPEERQAWAQQVEAIPDPRERAKAQAKLFGQTAQIDLARARGLTFEQWLAERQAEKSQEAEPWQLGKS